MKRYEEFGPYIAVFKDADDVHMEISWCSIGSVSVERAQQFAADMKAAIEYAKSKSNA